MLELTFFTPEAHVKCFTTPRIVIGAGSSDLEHIPLPQLEWEPEHLIFLQDPQGTWAINQANDPFVLLDNRPFSKRRLDPNVSYQIALRGLSILCRVSAPQNEEILVSPSQSGEDDLMHLLQEVENFPRTSQSPSQAGIQKEPAAPPAMQPKAPLRLPKHPSTTPNPSAKLPSSALAVPAPSIQKTEPEEASSSSPKKIVLLPWHGI